jgi:hypothetical protein
MKSYIYIILLFLFLASCNDILDSDSNLRQEEIFGNTVDRSYFPNTVGSMWHYNVYDSKGAPIDKLIVRITEHNSDRISSEIKCWNYSYKLNTVRNYKKYIELRGNKVIEYDEADGQNGHLMYDLPLTVGKSWFIGRTDDALYKDSAYVLANKTFSYYGNVFTSYQIGIPYYGIKDITTKEIRYFVPNIGLVAFYYAENTLNEEKYELYNYKIGTGKETHE